MKCLSVGVLLGLLAGLSVGTAAWNTAATAGVPAVKAQAAKAVAGVPATKATAGVAAVKAQAAKAVADVAATKAPAGVAATRATAGVAATKATAGVAATKATAEKAGARKASTRNDRICDVCQSYSAEIVKNYQVTDSPDHRKTLIKAPEDTGAMPGLTVEVMAAKDVPDKQILIEKMRKGASKVKLVKDEQMVVGKIPFVRNFATGQVGKAPAFAFMMVGRDGDNCIVMYTGFADETPMFAYQVVAESLRKK